MTAKKMTRGVFVGLCAVIGMSCSGCGDRLFGPRYLDPQHAPTGPGWKALFNGKDLTGWRPRTTERSMSWKAVRGMMVNTSSHDEKGVDIITEEKFSDFEIYYEYNAPPKGNSGVYLRGRIEIQVCDDAGHPGYTKVQRNGAIYNAMAISKEVSRPPGEWQSVYAKIVGQRVTVVLNGVKVIDNYEATRATGAELDRKMGTPGPIMIQGDHSSVEVRNIFIRPIQCKSAG